VVQGAVAVSVFDCGLASYFIHQSNQALHREIVCIYE
jgi:hypothetical protein